MGARFLGHLERFCAAFFPGMAIQVLPKPLSLKAVSSRENEVGHKQYLIRDIMQMLSSDKEVLRHRRAFCKLGITLEDIYPGEEWNFVYGQANMLERAGVFSFARHSPLFSEGVHATDADGLAEERLLTWVRSCRHTMVHEAVHMLGIKHCVHFRCLMNGNNGPGDTCTGVQFLCPVCLRKVLFALKALDPGGPEALVARYEAMKTVLLEHVADRVERAPWSVAKDIGWLERRQEQVLPDPEARRAAVAASAASPLSLPPIEQEPADARPGRRPSALKHQPPLPAAGEQRTCSR